ncbi:MAG: DUF3592 domain-containing protein [Bryobacteraceae bacterium]|jgi:hypothetical protein
MIENWKPPDGLGYSGLRPVQLTGGGIALVVVAAALLLGAVAAGIGLGMTASRQGKEHRLLSEQGVNTDARITRLWRSGGKDRQYLVAYRFTVQERAYDMRKKVPSRIWQKLTAGSSLPVRFLPSNPKVNHPSGWNDTPMPPWVPYLVFGGLAAIACLCAIQLRNQMQLLTEGRPAPGIVTGQRRTKDGTVIRYEFVLLNGATAKGRGQSRRPPAIGSQICVLYDPENPRRNAPYPLSLVKLTRSLKTP